MNYIKNNMSKLEFEEKLRDLLMLESNEKLHFSIKKDAEIGEDTKYLLGLFTNGLNEFELLECLGSWTILKVVEKSIKDFIESETKDKYFMASSLIELKCTLNELPQKLAEVFYECVEVS